MDDRLLLFWGKARPSAPGSPNFHPALLHCLDVAAAASALSEKGFATGLDRLAPMLPCLAALHDIGKFTRGFQQQCPQHWPESAFGPFRTIGSERHDTTGYWLLRVHCRDEIDALFPGMQQKAIHALLRAIGGHHGRPPREADDGDDPYPPGLCPASAAIAHEVARTLIDVLSPTPISGLTRADARRLSWSLAGIVTLADWIGSGPHFPYVDATGITDLHQYFDAHALPRARHAVRMSGLHAAKTRTFTGIASLFPEIAAPSPVQDWASAVELPVGPVLAIIEDSTGSGKTEAALTLAHRLLVDGRADGIFVGLPTMATAGAMFERLKG